jgi:hypothetical protein
MRYATNPVLRGHSHRLKGESRECCGLTRETQTVYAWAGDDCSVLDRP